jgi:hypothetical protein
MLAGEKSMDFTNDYYVPEDFDAMYGTVNPSQGRAIFFCSLPLLQYFTDKLIGLSGPKPAIRCPRER